MTSFRYYIITFLLLLTSRGINIMAADDAKSKLLMDVVEVCTSGNHEPIDCQLMRQAAETFEIPELASLAEMRENKVLDEGYKQELTVTMALLEYAKQHYGQSSKEAILCRRKVLGPLIFDNLEIAFTIAKENENYAITLSKKKPKDKEATLIKQTTKLDRMSIQSHREMENPLLWKEVFETEKAIEPFIRDSTFHSPLLADICTNIASWKNGGLSSPDFQIFVWYLSNVFFPEGCYIPGWISNGYLNNAEGFYQRAFDDLKNLWGMDDVRTLMAETRLIECKRTSPSADYEPQHKRLQEIQEYFEEYLPTGDLTTIETELIKWEFDIYFNKNTYEIRSPFPMLMKIEICCGDKNERFLYYHQRLMNLNVQCNPDYAKRLATEDEQLINIIFEDKPDMQNAYSIFMHSVKDVLGGQDQSTYQEYVRNISTTYSQNHNPSWTSIYIGKCISQIYDEVFKIYDEAAEYYKMALDDLCSIAGKDSPISAICHASYLQLLSSANDQEKKNIAETIVDDVIALSQKYDLSVADLYQTKYNLAFNSDIGKSIQALRDGINACKKTEDGMWRCIMQLELANILSNNKDYSSMRISPEAKALYEEAIPFFMKNKESINGFFFMGYDLIADYYWKNGQYAKAEETYLDGIEHSEMVSGQWNDFFIAMIKDLFSLYLQTNDLDKADKLIESSIKKAELTPSVSIFQVLLQLSWERYDLLVMKNVDFLQQVDALKKTTIIAYNLTNIMASISDSNSSVLKTYLNKVFYAYGDISQIYAKGIKECEDILISDYEDLKEVVRVNYEGFLTYKEGMTSTIKPYIQSIIDDLMKSGVCENDVQFSEPYNFMAQYYINLMNDTIKGEGYYQKLLEIPLMRTSALASLADLEFAQGKYEQAASYLEQKMKEPVYKNYANSINKSSTSLMLSSCYYLLGRYQEALQQAREHYFYQQEQIATNFNFLTQTERESFVDKGGGSGSKPICALLHVFPKELAAETYDAMLAEKGLQLRASERIKRAIVNSGDTVLIAIQDSLNILNSIFKTMNPHGTTLEEQNQYLEIRQQIEALERRINRQAAQFIEGMETPDWKKLQSVLKPEEAAVEYVFSDSIIGALVLLSTGEPQFVPLTPVNLLWTSLLKIGKLSTGQKSEALYEEDCLHLYDRLWQPMDYLLNHIKTVYYSPIGDLNELAFSAFKYPDGSYLSDHYDLRQMLSTGDLVTLREKATDCPIKTAMLYGAVYYSPEQELLAHQIANGERLRGKIDDQRGAILNEEEAFGYLSFTKEEVDHVNTIMKNKQIVAQQLTGFSPTEKTLHDISEKSPDILHLSTHGFFIRDDKEAKDNKFLSRFPSMQFSSMQRSGLALVGANRTWEGATDKPEEADGIITANEVALLDLSHTRLAVLSACQTAVGQSTMEGVFGMHRGFKQAGVKSILATLWNVNDKSTARLMELFYGKWLSGTPMQQSLHEAVKELRKEYPSPFYWAPFVLMDAED